MSSRFWISLVVLVLAGCGWQYAAEVEKKRTMRPQRTEAAPRAKPPLVKAPVFAVPSNTIVVGARDLFTLGENHLGSVQAQPQEMHKHAFRVRFVDTMNDATQLVHCSSGRIASVKQRRATPDVLATLEAGGVPPGVWILEVDPSGARLDLPNNDWYRHIVKYHRLEYVDRHRQRKTVLYRYLGPRLSLSLGR